MKTTLRLCAVVCACLLAGCVGTMLPGKLYSLGDAPTVLEFQIEISFGTGKITAKNPKTGESFDGQYTGVMHHTAGSSAPIVVPTGATALERGAQQGAAIAAAAPKADYATARGVLIGDKGTTIELTMEIQPGLKPSGHGEGQDNKGVRYQVQF